MRHIQAKFKSRCKETGNLIIKGDLMLYDPLKKICYSQTSDTYKTWMEQQDPAAGAIQANEDAYFDNFCQRNNI